MASDPFKLFMEATNASVVERVDVPARSERRQAPPEEFLGGAIANWLVATTGDSTIWQHQAVALALIAAGKNVVISTSTASGKTLVFQVPIIRQLLDGRGRALLLYPQKSLISDQERRMKEAVALAGLDPSLVGVIHGDICMAEREEILANCKIILATSDTLQSWFMRQSATPLVQQFLASLSLLVIDEAHALEGVFGTNAAFLLRRLDVARIRAIGNIAGAENRPLQIIAATATIHDPAAHLEKLTGARFEVVGEPDNGAPFHGLTLVHAEGPAYGSAAEKLAADYAARLAEVIGEDAFICFHDSRQGIERIVRSTDHPAVLPYRGGYDSRDRRRIEELLRANQLRGLIATSAMELGVDVQQFRVGLNTGIPQTRKTFRQRVGRIGRNSAGLFVVIDHPAAFAQLGTTLREFYEGPVEPSHIYEHNRPIQYQQARCLVEECPADELEKLGGDWPSGFLDMVKIAQPGSARPRDLDHIASLGGDCPHIAYPLRAMCDVTYALRNVRNPHEPIGQIDLEKALREAYTGATYLHLGRPYRVTDWRQTSYDRSIMLEPVQNAPPTQPMLKTHISVSLEAAEIIDGRHLEADGGCLAEISLRVTDSVEGYRMGSTAVPYWEARKSNPKMRRRSREWRSTGILVRISEPWFSGTGDASVEAREQIAVALKAVLAVEHNIAPAELRSAHQNINSYTAAGAKPVDDSIVIFDNVNGGLRLSAPLFWSFAALLDRLDRAVDLAGDDALLARPLIQRLRDWHACLGEAQPHVGNANLRDGELVVFAPESEVGVRIRGVVEERKLIEPQFLSMGDQDVLMYKYEAAPDVHAWVSHDHVQAIGGNWSQVIWNPALNKFREIEA